MDIKKVQSMTNGETTTYEGGKSYVRPFKETVAEFFSLGLLNGNFYESEKQVLQNAKHIFEKALVECPEFATKAAIYGNNENSLKLVPMIWLAYVSTLEDKTLFKKAFNKIIRNPKMLYDFMELIRKTEIRQGLGRSVKTAMNNWLEENLNEYQVSRNKNKLLDIIKVTRPNFNGKEDLQKYMAYISKDELTFERAIVLKETIEELQKGNYNDKVKTNIKNHRLQLEELKHSTANLSDEDKKNLYKDMYETLNYAALILNLVALERVFATKTRKVSKYSSAAGSFSQNEIIETDIPDEIIKMVVAKIEDVNAYKRSNMLPFALLNASTMVVTPEFKTAVYNMFKTSCKEAFKISKDNTVLVGVDTSGSMHSPVSNEHLQAVDVASLFGSMIKKAYTPANIYAVATYCKPVNVNAQDSIEDMSKKIRNVDVGYGTNFETILKNYNQEKYVIIITDSEQSDNFERIWRKTNKPEGAKVIVWQLRPYGRVISKDADFIYLQGYSDRMFALIKKIIENGTTQIDEIEKIEL